MQRLVFRVSVCVVSKPGGGGEREPTTTTIRQRACVWWPMSRAPRLMGAEVGVRVNLGEKREETISGGFRTG